jgi:hypothetical protein
LSRKKAEKKRVGMRGAGGKKVKPVKRKWRVAMPFDNITSADFIKLKKSKKKKK